jgi:DNA repair protein RadD
MILRYYQTDLLNRARAAFKAGHRRVLMVAPTGAGKTVLAASMLGGAAKKRNTSMFLVHRRELLKQTSATFRQVGIDHGIIGAGFEPDPLHGVQLAGVQSLVRRLGRYDAPDMIVVDEAHHSVAGSWDAILAAYPDAKVIGLTATPERFDGKGLGSHFDVIVEGPTTASLIADGHLSQFDYYAPGKPDMVGVRTTAGDFNRGDLDDIMDKPRLIGDVVEHYLKLAPGQRGIVFAVSIEHSRHLADAFNAAGVKAAHVDGESRDRDAVVASFQRGETTVMTNVDLFGEGFDVPGIVYAGLCRPTKSLALFLQQCGRALRTAPGKQRAIICDHGGNAFIHGLPDEARVWSLEGRKARAKGAGGPSDAQSIRQCLECYAIAPSTAEACPCCGTVFPVQSREVEQQAGELSKLERAALVADQKQKMKQEEWACKTLDDWKRLAERRGYKPGWALFRWKARSGRRAA